MKAELPETTSATLELDPELRLQLLAEAAAEDSSVSAFLAHLLHEHVANKKRVQDYDAWFDAEIEAALTEADDPRVERLSNELVTADLRRRIASLQKRI